MLAGCATTAQGTFTQSLLAAESAADVAVTTTTTLLQSGQITSSQAAKVMTVTDGVNATLTLANNTYNAGGIATAQTQIATAASILVTLQSCLSASAAKQSIDTCLAPLVSK